MIVGKLLEKTEEEAMGGRLGYNAATGEFEDLVKAGVIDPLKVRARLQCCRPRPYKPSHSHCLLAVLVAGSKCWKQARPCCVWVLVGQRSDSLIARCMFLSVPMCFPQRL